MFNHKWFGFQHISLLRKEVTEIDTDWLFMIDRCWSKFIMVLRLDGNSEIGAHLIIKYKINRYETFC